MFSTTITVATVLQSPQLDLKSALDHINDIVKHFENIRNKIDEDFTKIFNEAKTLLSKVGEDVRIPRMTSLQRHRENYHEKEPEMYYRIALAIPILDDLISQLKHRFTDHNEVLCALSVLIPSLCYNETLDLEALRLYEDKVDLDLITSEYELWKIFWMRKKEGERPASAIEALGECNKELFPNIFTLLKVASSLPVTTATPERTFSTLRRLKTYLRNSCGQERLTGLALMAIHREISIPTDEVVNKFAFRKDRRLDFVL